MRFERPSDCFTFELVALFSEVDDGVWLVGRVPTRSTAFALVVDVPVLEDEEVWEIEAS